jgi:ATP-dependent exoDNAse (exonuclease V) alpha subunit
MASSNPRSHASAHAIAADALTANFDGRAVTYGFGELDTLVPACAATIPKSQGSEYPESSSPF